MNPEVRKRKPKIWLILTLYRIIRTNYLYCLHSVKKFKTILNIVIVVFDNAARATIALFQIACFFIGWYGIQMLSQSYHLKKFIENATTNFLFHFLTVSQFFLIKTHTQHVYYFNIAGIEFDIYTDGVHGVCTTMLFYWLYGCEHAYSAHFVYLG